MITRAFKTIAISAVAIFCSRERSFIKGFTCAVVFSVFGTIVLEESADAAEGQRSSALEEVVVTAQRREESIRDVPIAMQAFTAETLKQLGIVDTRDLANFIPGFTFADSGRDNPIYTLRGVGFDDGSRTANSAVGVYVGEVPIPYPYMTQGADVDLARIEVLKGPQGTLYGRNTTGGAINYIPKKPTDALEFGVEAEYGRFERYNAEGYVSGPFTDRLKGRIAFRTIESSEGWQVSLTRPNDRLGEKDKQAARGTLKWEPVDALRLNLRLDWWRDRSEPQAPQPIAIVVQNAQLSEDQIHPDVRNHPLEEGEDSRSADWTPGIDWTLDNEMLMPAVRAYWDLADRVSLTLIAAYTDFETGTAWLPTSGLSNNNNELKRSTEASARSIELRADGRFFEDRLSWLLGLYASKDSLHDSVLNIADTNSAVFNVQPGVVPLANLFLAIGEQDTRSEAVFINGEYMLTDSFNLSFGARYTEEVKRYFNCTRDHPDNEGVGIAPLQSALSLAQGGNGGAEPGDCYTLDEETRDPGPIHKKLEEDNLGGKVALTWTPTGDHLFYASYSRGFKSGSFPLAAGSEGEQFDPVTQERLDSIEVGGKTSWFNDSLRVDFAVFDYDYKDKQLESFFIDPNFGPLFKLFNAPKAKVQGAELEIQSSPLPGLSLSVAGSYLDTEIEEFIGTTSDGEENIDFSGNDLPYAPKHSFTLLANYNFPLPFLSSLEGMAGIDYSYNSKTTTEIENNPLFDVASYKLVNARIGVGDVEGRWDVTGWARNATDEFYQLNVPQVAADTRVRYTGMPRTYGVTFSYHYF